MEWLNERLNFSSGDLSLLEFVPRVPFRVHTGSFQFSSEDHLDEEKYLQWVENIKTLSSRGTSFQPGIYLVMHPQLPAANNPGYKEIGYKKETYKHVSKQLFQHRSILGLIRRISTSIFNYRTVNWDSHPELGPAIVYNCKSDDESPAGPNSMAMSTTCFPDASLTFAMLYGCTETTISDVSDYLELSEKWGPALHHPLILPMIFATLERGRLLNQLERSGDGLSQRIMDLKIHLREDDDDIFSAEPQGMPARLGRPARRWFFRREKAGSTESRRGSDERPASTSTKECEATELWIQVSSLKDGLESFRDQLQGMLEHCRWLTRMAAGSDDGAFRLVTDPETGEKAERMLAHMVGELDCKIRSSKSVLGGMVMAMQVEWNYNTRRDAKATIIIAKRTKLDSSQMKTISRLGMVFLPGTFLATIFSMSFFKWIPEGSSHVVSPWIVVFFILALLTTGLTWWRFGLLMAAEEKVQQDDIESGLASDKASVETTEFRIVEK